MAITFGKTNEMIKSQFQESTSFFELRIIRIKEDKSLDQNTKDWFIKRYEEKINILKNTYECLDEVINEKRLQGIFVDENSATLKSLNNTSNNKDPFEDMSHSTKKLRVAKAFKVLGAILLPVVGTIPFLISLNKAKKKHEAITNILRSENNEIKNFVNTKKRPYDATIGQNIAFSEVDMQNLLKTQSEIQRLQNLLTSSALNPIEKKNLTEKLIALKEYAQNNNYTLSTGILDSAEFKTKLDKKNDNINAFYTKNNTAVNSTSPFANFKDAYDEIVKLDKIKEEANSMLADSSGNQILLDIIKKADNRKSTIITQLENFITTNIPTLITTLNTTLPANTLPTTKEECNNKKTSLKNVYDNDFTSKFGSGVESVSSKLAELGISTTALDNFKSIYDSKVSWLDAEIAKYNTKETVSEYLNFIQDSLTKFELSGEYHKDNLNNINIDDAQALLNEIKTKLDYLKNSKALLDNSQKTNLVHFISSLDEANNQFLDKKAEIGYTKIGFKNYQNLAETDTNNLDLSRLTLLLSQLETTNNDINQENYLQTFLSDGGQQKDLIQLKSDIAKKIAEAKQKEQELTVQQTANDQEFENISSHIESILSDISSNNYTLPWLQSNKESLTNYIDRLDDSTFTSNLSVSKQFEVSALKQRATTTKTYITKTMQAEEDFKNALSTHETKFEELQKRLVSAQTTPKGLKSLLNDYNTLLGSIGFLELQYHEDLSEIKDLIKKSIETIENMIENKKNRTVLIPEQNQTT